MSKPNVRHHRRLLGWEFGFEWWRRAGGRTLVLTFGRAGIVDRSKYPRRW